MAKDEERIKKIKEKLCKKCRTCENYGPNFGCCFVNNCLTNRRGICDKWEPLNDEELSEYSDEELEQEGFFEF